MILALFPARASGLFVPGRGEGSALFGIATGRPAWAEWAPPLR